MSDDEGVTATGRARRKTAKRVNYAKEQEFSDQDVFEDSEEEAAPVAPKRKPGRPRKSKGAATSGAGPSSAPTMAAMEEEDDTEYASRQVYTEKGYDPSLPPIRERFPFLPEYEEDGSPKIELIVGRRAVDEKEDSPDDEEAVEKLESDDDEPRATRRRSSKKNPSPTKNESGTGGPVEYEYLVKYKGRSYLHLEWKTGADLESMNKSAKGIYRRWLKKLQQGVDEDLENPEFDPSYVVPEKIIDEADQEITVELTDKELLKWEKEREKELAEEDDDDDDDEKMDDEATDDKPGEETPKEDSGEKESDGKEKDEAGEAGEEEKKGEFARACIVSLKLFW